jgi:hypothetical protein
MMLSEARTFMDGYGRDLAAGDRAAIAARYDRNGAYLIRNGRRELFSFDQIRGRYANPAWTPPQSFNWIGLVFDPIDPNVIVVSGRFACNCRAGGPTEIGSYLAVLRRQGRSFGIRVEDEKLPI